VYPYHGNILSNIEGQRVQDLTKKTWFYGKDGRMKARRLFYTTLEAKKS